MTTVAEPRQALVVLEPADHVAFAAERDALVAEVSRELPTEIVSPQTYAAMADFDRRLGEHITQVGLVFDPLCANAHAVWKQATSIRAAFLQVPTQLKAQIRGLLGHYKEAEDRRRRDEEHRLALEEQQREEARRNQEAKLAEKQGDKALAKAIRQTPVTAPTVVLPDQVPQVGLSYRTDWGWRPIGGDTPKNRQRALCMVVPAQWAQFVKWDDAALTAFAGRTKGTVKVPGIEFFSKQVPVRR